MCVKWPFGTAADANAPAVRVVETTTLTPASASTPFTSSSDLQ